MDNLLYEQLRQWPLDTDLSILCVD